MSVEIERATLPCNVCAAQVTELRRGRCWGCYTRWVESRPVGKGAACSVCTERRRDQLKLVELHGKSVPFCHSCAARMIKLAPMPETLGEIRTLLRRDRRDDDRRQRKLDRRLFPRERRVGERRVVASARHADTDPQIRLDDVEDVIIEIEDADLELVEQTMVRERPTAAAPPSLGLAHR